MEKIYVDANIIIELFSIMNVNDIEYVLLKNLDNELPNKLTPGKDIDIIVHPNYKKKIETCLETYGWIKSNHPWDFGNNFIFLYSMDPFIMYVKNNVAIDICFQLNCRSLNAGEWFPLDEQIQKSVFNNKRTEKGKPWLSRLSYEDELIHLITRSIFDKKKFTLTYINQIEYLYKRINTEDFYEKLELVFFKFHKTLINSLENKNYKNIRDSYLQFKNY